MRSYDYRHVVGFEDTSLAGNVYFANHLHWQGRARELFLHEHAPDLLKEMENGLALITLRCSCEYLDELVAFDEVTVSMSLAAINQNRIVMRFEYWREGKKRTLVAKGEQEIACMYRSAGRLLAAAIPKSLREALVPFAQVAAR